MNTATATSHNHNHNHASTMTLAGASTGDAGRAAKRAFCTHTEMATLPTHIDGPLPAILSPEDATEVYVYQRQYSHVYDHRLTMLQKPRLFGNLFETSSASRIRIHIHR
jgi:hypothetical protein